LENERRYRPSQSRASIRFNPNDRVGRKLIRELWTLRAEPSHGSPAVPFLVPESERFTRREERRNAQLRFEYIHNSANSSVDANFLTLPNDNESKILRWEIKPPLQSGDGGVLRLRVRVR
jgi:hypothetical protein